MNPFTRFLRQWSDDNELAAFIERWDTLERLVIRVYKGGTATQDDEVQYATTREWLLKEYRRWQAPLLPLWQQASVAGEPAGEDPFLRLLRHETAADFVGNWNAMQNLPAAREALNKLLVELSQD